MWRERFLICRKDDYIQGTQLGLWSGATSEDRCERTEQIVKFPLEAASRATRLTRPENRVVLQIRKAAKLDGKGLGDLSSPRAQRRVATRLIGSRAAPVGKDRRRVRHFLPSAVMAGFACLRGRTARTGRPCPPHVEQRQFYCVKLPRRRTQGAGGQLPIQDRRRRAGSELGRQIPVDLQAYADLNEDRGCPGHSSSSLTFRGDKRKFSVDQDAHPRKPRQ